MLEPCGDVADGERRGVRREDRVCAACDFERDEHLTLGCQVLEHRLDHELAAGELRSVRHEAEARERVVACGGVRGPGSQA